ncbi:MAG: methyltransferase regulatory domain-containing protein [Rhodospirillaceae bacterium]|nr:methyltransferase regulatory domain-containing protein [Rhodospirillaceae bacterium]
MADSSTDELAAGFPGGAFRSHGVPAHLVLSALLAGVVPPEINRPWRYLLVGIDDHRIPALLAAAHPQAQVLAVDDDRDRLAAADRLIAGQRITNLRLECLPLAALGDVRLPGAAYDMVAVPTLFARLGDADRKALAHLLGRSVAPGGLVQVAYPCLPGAAALLSAQHLIRTAGPGAVVDEERIDRAMALIARLVRARAEALAGNRWLAASLRAWRAGRRRQLADLWLAAPWHAFYHWDVVRTLAAAGLNYAGPTVLSARALAEPVAAVVRPFDDPAIDETLCDLLHGRMLRSDLYVHGPLRLTADGQAALLSQVRLAQVVTKAQALARLEKRLDGADAAADLQPMLAALAARPQPAATLTSLQPPGPARLPADRLLRLLVSSGVAQAIPPDDRRAASVPATRINAASAHEAIEDNPTAPGLLVAGATGGLMAVDGIAHLAYLALVTGSGPFVDAVLPFVARRLSRGGGRPPDMDALRDRLAAVLQDDLPVWRRLGMV